MALRTLSLRIHLRTLLLTALLTLALPLLVDAQQACLFPESDDGHPILVNVTEGALVGSIVVESTFEPADAELLIASINSGNLAQEEYRERFELQTTAKGQFVIRTRKPLSLPPYPSIVEETFLYINLLCNGQQYSVITVRVQSVNDHAPWFYGQIPYRIGVKESAPLGTTFETPILALDWDPAQQYGVTFAIESGNEDGTFELEAAKDIVHNPNALPIEFTGHWTTEQLPPVLRMKLVKPLDYDYGKRKYSLIISATDNGIPQLKNQTELQIDVEDVDDRAPTFTKADYYGNISLEAKVGSAIATDQLIQAMDGDPGVLAQIVYSIEGDNGNYFQIDKSSGAVHLAKPLPKRSPLSSNKLILKAAQRDDPEKAASATLHLQVLDDENAEPSFNPCLYNASLLENSPSGAQVVRLRASDPDEGANGRFTYYLVDGTSETAAFSVDPDSGQIVVANNSALDRELTPIITIQSRLRTFINNQSASSAVSATSDRGDICRTATITVRLLDDNDNTPIFDRAIYRFTISDKALNGSVVGSVSASDADEGENSAVHYGQLEHEFDADPNAPRFKGVLMPDGSFEIVLAYNARPTYRPLYRLNLEAIDGGRHSRSSRTRIEISVNLSSTHVPVFDTDDFSSKIDDDLKNRSPVLKARANDPDAVSENFPNTHLPVFEKDDYSTDIDEDLKNGSPVLKVSATDPDEGEGGEFTYMLMSDSTAFVIDPVTGWISVNDSSQLDRELHEGFEMTVTTKQKIDASTTEVLSGPTEVAVAIRLRDVNDNAPVFVDSNGNRTNRYHFEISNEVAQGQLIGRVAALDMDRGDAGKVEYVGINITEFFKLEEDGSITIAKALPRPSTVLAYSFVIEARDLPANRSEQRHSMANVDIAIDPGTDGRLPRFNNLPKTVAVSESFPRLSLVFTVDAQDPQGSGLIYTIIGGNSNGTFAMRDDEVIVANELDAETNARYNLTIEIKTITSGIAINSTLGITVEDANDIAPMFEREKYNFRLDNPQQTGAVVGSVKATDGDLTAPNNVIGSYQMERSAEGFFYVDAKSGAITAGEKLRTESYDEYSFSVTARDTGDPSLQAVTVVTVHMDGKTETDIPPRFDQSNYRFTIYENNPRPVRIGSVNAYHSGGNIEYSLAELSPFFTINGQTGDLDAHVVFDYEVRKNYTTLVKACVVGNSTSDSAPKQLCSDASVVLDILDVNDNAPAFEQASYTLNVPVDIGVGAEILRVHAIDSDSFNNGDLSYVLKTQTGIFAVDYETGVVTIVGAMTAPNIFNLTIEAFDHGTPTLRGTTVVSIVANGSNPSAPEFDKFRYDVTQPSTVDVGTLLVTLKATDPDPGLEGLVIYRFANDSVTQQQAPSFSLNQESGELKTIKLLDYHTKASYQLVIEAVDSSPFYPRKAQTVVRIQLVDSGNNSPKFLPLPDTVFVSTLKPPGSMIVRALAADGEGTPISYSLEGGDGFFEMDNERLVVLKELQSGKFPLTISATDGRQTTSHAMTVVVMADRDKYPVFPQLSYRIQVPINANFPYLVQPFQAKVQTGSLRYEIILPQPPIQGLSIDPAMGDLFVNADFIANRSVGGRPVFAIIRATNNDYEAFYSDVTVEIAITNNQSGLNFPSQLFRLTVDENTPANTKLNLSIIVARASLYPNVRYRLEPNDTFSVDATTGQLVVIKETDLEKMTKQSNGIFDLTIYATTSNETTKSNVQIKINDVNEFTPKFDKAVYAVKISENIRAGEFIVQVRAFDQDYSEGDKLIYRIKDGSAKDYITIDETGNIYKSNGSALDREQADRLNITIEAVDRNGNTDEARIDFEIVDYNDNAPQFVGEPFTWNVTEGPDGIGQTFRLRASDLDQGQNGAITFRITQGNELKLFLLRNISNSEAELSVITELDREDKDRRILTIEARDNGDPSLVSLTTVEVLVQDVNDNPPHFMKSLYDQKVPADFPIGFSLFTVLADDPDSDSKINYTIVDETPVSGIFTIDATQGFVRFGRRPPLVNQTYTLTIEASDGLFTDRANISIQVYTTNDSRPTGQNLPPVFEQPQYEFSVVEGEWNTRVGQVEVTDPDSDAFLDMWIEPPDYRELFWVANASGYIYTKTALEYSVGKESYSFIIVAQDFGIPPLTAFTNVKVIIIDVNDHAPKFDRSDYSALIPAEARPPYPLSLMIKATDMDAGLNAKIKYSLSGEDADCFEIDSASAQIQLTCTPDYTSKTKYLMDVIATDRDGDGNSTIVQLSVLVSPPVVTSEPVTVDPNVTTSTTTTQITPTGQSCQPQFSPSTDTLTLVESRPVDDPVFIAIARCGECSTACRPTYSLIKPTSEAAGYFTLSTDGLLKLAKQLSVDDMTANGVLDASSSLTLTINATLASGESAQLTLTIRVVKQDIKPGEAVRFERLSYTFSIEEEQAEGATVGTVVAIPPNGQTTITYTIESEQFRMNQDKPGVIETTQQLDADGPNNRREYNLIVEATSGSSTATTLVIVKLIDINDNAPKFSESLYTSLMPEGTYGHTVVSFKPNNLAAFDADQGHNALLTYHIVNDDPTLPFIIDKTTGELSLVGTVDRENIPYYIFTVTATDDGTPQLNGSTTVNVTILDVNDNYPEFINATAVVAVSEDWQTGREIARFYAEDKDGDQLGHVLYGLSNFTDSFAIDAEDGILTSIKPFLITQQDIYLVPIVARDLGRPALRRTHILRVEVFPKDQYDPLFKESVYAASVANGSQPGDFIIQVTAGVGPFEYGIVDDYSGLFAIDAKTGVIILGRLPIDQEKNRYHELNVTARNVTNSAIASTMVNVFFESDTTTTPAPDTCTFSNKQYNAEIYENINATTLLIDLNATCESSGSFYAISQGTDEFEINNRTGELYAVKPLDRERRSLHFITINVTKIARLRLRRQVNPIIEREKAKLLPMQTLVVVRVLDVNDNTPVFVNVGPDGITYSYTVDWQAAIGTIIGTIKAFDRDESSKVTYSISALTEGDGSKFSIDPVSGQLSLAVSLANINQDVFKFDVAATDNDTTKPLLAPVVVYRLSLGVNLVLITSNKPAHTINNDLFERKLTELTGWTMKILAKQAYVADNGDVDPNNRLDQLLGDLQGPDLGVEGIALPVIQDSAAISVWELVLLVICALIIFTAFLGVCFLLRWWNRSSKDRKKKLESEYMVDSTSSGPRPYNVETLDRKTAQNTLVSKRQAAYAPSAVPTIRMKVNGIPPITAAPYTDTSDISNENSSRGSNTSVLSRPHPSCDEYGVIGPRSRNFAGGDMEAIRTLARRPLPPNEMGSWTNRSPSLHRLALSYRDRSDDR